MSVSCECCVLSSRCLCVRLITRPRAVLRECGVSECDCEAMIMRLWPQGAVVPVGGGVKILTMLCSTYSSCIKEGSIQASSCMVLP
jgi:hypothetical protein